MSIFKNWERENSMEDTFTNLVDWHFSGSPKPSKTWKAVKIALVVQFFLFSILFSDYIYGRMFPSKEVQKPVSKQEYKPEMPYSQLDQLQRDVLDIKASLVLLTDRLTMADTVPLDRHADPFDVEVTSYCDGHTTATGIPVASGACAVDPAVIPIGTLIRLQDFKKDVPEWVMANDTGKAVKGKILDIYTSLNLGRMKCRAVWVFHERLKTWYLNVTPR